MPIPTALKWLPLAALLFTSAREMRARALARHDYPAPGQMVTLADGHRLQLDCRGSGSPTVVFESGLDHLGSLAWVSVHDSMARATRSCAYSRAGLTWSDPVDGRFDSQRNARDLHAALTRAGERGPWLMVGHSIGVPYIMTFTQLYPAEVAGLVFVDGTHPEQFARWEQVTGKSLQPSATIPRIGVALSWTGLVRALPLDAVPAHWPQATRGAPAAFLPVSVAAMAAEITALSQTLATAASASSLGDRPLIVLAADTTVSTAEGRMMGLSESRMDALRTATLAMRAEQSAWSSRGRLVFVRGASHNIHLDRPDVVLDAIRSVMIDTRTLRSGVARAPDIN